MLAHSAQKDRKSAKHCHLESRPLYCGSPFHLPLRHPISGKTPSDLARPSFSATC